MKNNQNYLSAGIFIGAGLGGLFNTVVLQDIFQLHDMFSADLISGNSDYLHNAIYWNGLLELLLLLPVVTGIFMLWREGRNGREHWPGPIFFCSFFSGWGLYTITEGLLAHQLLGIHHVYQPGGLVFDFLYLLAGLIMIIASYSRVISINKKKIIGTRNHFRGFHRHHRQHAHMLK